MAALETIQIPLGFKAPDFSLPNVVTGQPLTLADVVGEQATVFMFICNHCPYVKHVLKGLVSLANDYMPRGINFVAISSNDVFNYPDDDPVKMKELARTMSFPFPYLYDESQDVARAYHAVCTPDFSVFDASGLCVYRGQLDGSRPGNHIPVTGQDIRAVLDAILAGTAVSDLQIPSIGCSIKWKA